MSRLQKAPKLIPNFTNRINNQFVEFVFAEDETSNINLIKKPSVKDIRENSNEKKKSLHFSPLKNTFSPLNHSDTKNKFFWNMKSPRKIQKKNKENFVSSPNNVSATKIKQELPKSYNQISKISKQKTTHDYTEPINPEIRKFSRCSLTLATNQDISLDKSKNSYMNKDPQATQAFKVDDSKTTINNELKLLDGKSPKYMSRNLSNPRNIIVKELQELGNHICLTDENLLTNYSDHNKSTEISDISTITSKNDLNMTEESPKLYPKNILTNLYNKHDNLYNNNNNTIWETFSKEYKNMIDEIKQDLTLDNYCSQFIRHYKDETISLSENLTNIIFDIKYLVKLLKVSNKEPEKEQTLKEYMTKLLRHNHELIDKNTQLNAIITKLENTVNVLNEKISTHELSTPRLFGEIDQIQTDERNIQSLKIHIENLHEFYASKFAIIAESLTGEENFDILNKKLKENSIEIPKCLDQKFSIYTRNNLEILSQIQTHLSSFTISKNIEKIDAESQTLMLCQCFTSINSAQNTKKDTKSMDEVPNLDTNQSEKSGSTNHLKIKNLSRLLSKKDDEITILKQKEVAYQATIYSLSNEIYEIKKGISKQIFSKVLRNLFQINNNNSRNQLEFISEMKLYLMIYRLFCNIENIQKLKNLRFFEYILHKILIC